MSQWWWDMNTNRHLTSVYFLSLFSRVFLVFNHVILFLIMDVFVPFSTVYPILTCGMYVEIDFGFNNGLCCFDIRFHDDLRFCRPYIFCRLYTYVLCVGDFLYWWQILTGCLLFLLFMSVKDEQSSTFLKGQSHFRSLLFKLVLVLLTHNIIDMNMCLTIWEKKTCKPMTYIWPTNTCIPRVFHMTKCVMLDTTLRKLTVKFSLNK